MFGLNGNPLSDFESRTTVMSYIVILIISVIACTPVIRNISERLKYSALNSVKAFAVYSAAQLVIPVVLLVLSAAALVGNSYNPFLYFKF